MILLDANVLVYATHRRAPQNDVAGKVVAAALEGKLSAALFPQVIMELTSTITDRRRVPDPITANAARDVIQLLTGTIPLLGVTPEALSRFVDILGLFPRTGPRIYDLFLAAQMQTHGITQICTYNIRDFTGLPNIEPLTPDQVLATLV